MSQATTHEQHLALAHRVVEALVSSPPLEHIVQIWLFGSVARGEDTERSDVDVMVTTEDLGKNFIDFYEKVFECLDQVRIPIRPRSRRFDRFPGFVQVEFVRQETFQNRERLTAQLQSGNVFSEATKYAKFLETIHQEGRQLYSKDTLITE